MAVRHAAPVLDGVCVGRNECQVTLAPEAAAELMRKVAGRVPHVVWSSPTRRCSEPARVLAHGMRTRLRLDPRLCEMSFGAWEGMAWRDIETRYSHHLRLWMCDWQWRAPPGGETVQQLEARVRSWYQRVDPEASHLLVAHAGVIRALRVIARGETWLAAMATPVSYLQAESFLLGA